MAYWKANVRLMIICLIIWFMVSFGFGIILRPMLDVIQIGGYKLGFWFAQQGSMYTFVALIFFYAYRMGVMDRLYDVHED
jgi:putative solute:sodium symporter small subunit